MSFSIHTSSCEYDHYNDFHPDERDERDYLGDHHLRFTLYINELKRKEEMRNQQRLEQRDAAMLAYMGRLTVAIAASVDANLKVARCIELLSIIAYGNIMHIIHSNPFLREVIIDKCHEIIQSAPSTALCALAQIVLSKLH